MAKLFKKMAGTAAVFVQADIEGALPVERDGLLWTEEELHYTEMPARLQKKETVANTLVLEGLEDYDKPIEGDVREVSSIGVSFVFLQKIHGWVQVGSKENERRHSESTPAS